MTDRVKYITVVVDANLREDDATPLIAAISMLKGVISVGFDIQDVDAYTAHARARNDLADKLLAVLYPKP